MALFLLIVLAPLAIGGYAYHVKNSLDGTYIAWGERYRNMH